MFEASVNGEPFDMDRWGAYFKPAGMMNAAVGNRNTDDDTPAPKPMAVKPQPKVEEDDEPPFEVEDTPAQTAPVQTGKPASQRAEDILAMIRNRQKQ